MAEIELQVQHDSTHRKPSVNFEIPVLSLKATCKDSDQALGVNAKDPNADSQADPPSLSAPSKKQVKKARIQFLTLCWTLFLAGWNDGSTGPLLPRIQEVYNVIFSRGSQGGIDLYL